MSNLPVHARFEDIEPLLTTYGQVQNVEKLSSRDPNTQTVLVSYETQEQAQQYVNFYILINISNRHLGVFARQPWMYYYRFSRGICFAP